jgi:hypothetical protein
MYNMNMKTSVSLPIPFDKQIITHVCECVVVIVFVG